MKSEARQDRPTFDIFLKKKGKWSIVHSLRGNFSNLDLGPKFPKRRRCTQSLWNDQYAMLQELCIGLASIIRAKCSWGSGKRSVQSLWPRSLELLSLRWVQIAFIQGYATLRSIHLIKLHQPVLIIIVSESSQLEWPRSGKPRRFGEPTQKNSESDSLIWGKRATQTLIAT